VAAQIVLQVARQRAPRRYFAAGSEALVELRRDSIRVTVPGLGHALTDSATPGEEIVVLCAPDDFEACSAEVDGRVAPSKLAWVVFLDTTRSLDALNADVQRVSAAVKARGYHPQQVVLAYRDTPDASLLVPLARRIAFFYCSALVAIVDHAGDQTAACGRALEECRRTVRLLPVDTTSSAAPVLWIDRPRLYPTLVYMTPPQSPTQNPA
jgi:hypothetical protein